MKNDLPRVIIGDNVASHLSQKVIQSCLGNNIRLVFLPPNARHLCQPLDVTLFRPLKTVWEGTLEDWKMRAKGVIPKHVFPGILKKVLDHVAPRSSANMKSGFRATGIFPLNSYAVLKRLPTE